MRQAIIIPCAGQSSRYSYPRCLIKLGDGSSILSRQINLLHKLNKDSEIIVVCGFQHERITNNLPNFVDYVINYNFENTGVAYSIGLGISQTDAERIIVIYGDLVFNTLDLTSEGSTIWVGGQKKDGIGIVSNNSQIIHMSYGLKDKWVQILSLENLELEIFKKEINKRQKKKFCTHEIINDIIIKGGKFKLKNCKNNIIEINNSKDVKEANTNIIFKEFQ